MVGDPVPHFELQHLALAIGLETKRRMQCIRRLLVVLKHEVSTHGRHVHRESHSQSPARNINFVDGLIADLTVSGVPDPVPVVVKAILRKRLHRRGAGPQVIMHSGWNGFFGSVPDRWPPLVAKRAGHIHLADRAVTQLLNGFQHSRIRSRLAAVLANSVVLLYGTHQLPSFKPVMRTRLLYIHIFPGLARPDGH